MLSYECVFVEHTSGCTRINNQVDINNNETIKAKITFEREAQINGVVIKGYHTNNGVFNA